MWVTYTETIQHTVEVDHLPEDEQEAMELLTSGEVKSVDYFQTAFEIVNVEE